MFFRYVKYCVKLLDIIQGLGFSTDALLKDCLVPPGVESEFKRMWCVPDRPVQADWSGIRLGGEGWGLKNQKKPLRH